MKPRDVTAIRRRFLGLTKRANESLGTCNDSTLGIGLYVPGKSPWERHTNGDELLLVTDGYVDIEVLEADGSSNRIRIDEGALFVVPKGKWHQLTATDNVNILYASPSEAGVERTREHPLGN
jgi:mannose-6-phosphate isomerase-like protein (cupin superfamily)